MTSKSSILYVNVIVHSVSEAIKRHVTKKLERAKVIPNSMVAQAAITASELASPKHVTQALSDEICRRMPENLRKRGIYSKMEFVFQESTFAVLELRLIYVDPLAFVSAWSEAGISCFLDCIGASNRKYFEEEYLPKVLASMIATEIPQILGESIADKKIDAETKVNKASDQAIYFFSTLNKVRMQADEKKRKNPIKKIRKRMSGQSSVGSCGSRSHRRQSSIGSGSHRRQSSTNSIGSGGSRHRRQSSLNSIGSGSHKRVNSFASLTLRRTNSNSSFANASQRSLNSIRSLDSIDDDKTVDTSGAHPLRTNGIHPLRGSKSPIWG